MKSWKLKRSTSVDTADSGSTGSTQALCPPESPSFRKFPGAWASSLGVLLSGPSYHSRPLLRLRRQDEWKVCKTKVEIRQTSKSKMGQLGKIDVWCINYVREKKLCPFATLLRLGFIKPELDPS